MNNPTLNLNIFVCKLTLIKFFYEHYQLSYDEIAVIVDSRAEIIQLYCKRLMN